MILNFNVMNSYLNYLDKKLAKGKNYLIEYVILFLFLGLITLTMVTFTIDNLETRLILFDISIAFGTNRIYNLILIIFTEILGLVVFKYFHLTTDKLLLFWIEIVNIFRGKYSRWTIFFRILLKGELVKIQKHVDYFSKNMTYNVIFTSKLT